MEQQPERKVKETTSSTGNWSAERLGLRPENPLWDWLAGSFRKSAI
jgi:hypothetical protein